MNATFITCPTYRAPDVKPLGWTGPRRTRDTSPRMGMGLPAFRRSFVCNEKPLKATIEATALGIFELWCNGTRVGHVHDNETVYDELKPGSTDFRHRVYTYRYDLTPYLSRENTLVAVVASGWWQGRISFGAFGDAPLAFACELKLQYAHTEQVISTDDTWECTIGGPTLFADIYDGEYTDARRPHPADEMNGYVWSPVGTYTDYQGKAEPRIGPPVRLRPDLERHAVSAVLWRKIDDDGTDYGCVRPRMKRVGDGCEAVMLRPGEHLTVDLGQNFAGRPRVTLTAESGTEVRLAVAEMLNTSGDRARGADGPKGSVYVENYRSARADITYVANGSGQETYHPLYTYYGFRYIDITASETVEIREVRGEVLTSDMPEVGYVETDNELLNRFISNVHWGRRSNYLHVPTDCPQRDERLGWTADTHIFAGAAAYAADIRAFMRKWLQDARDSQKTTGGAYADVIPHVLDNGFSGNAAWGDAGIIIPSVLYEMYGDTETMREHYPSMEQYMEYLAQFGYEGGRLAYGDWLAYEETDKRYVAVAYYANAAHLMETYSRILTRTVGDIYSRRAAHYHDLHEKIVAHFRARYVVDGTLTETGQTAYILALHFRLVEEDMRDTCRKALVEKIKANGYRLSTGFLGTGLIATTLTEIGEAQLVYALLTGTSDPSWLYSVTQGATTVWERWNSYTHAGGFGDVTMNSFNHYAYGAVTEWLWRGAAGIMTDPDNVGFGHLLLSPIPDLRQGEMLGHTAPLRRLAAVYDSIAGRVESAWHWEGERFVYRCTVPAEITATIRMPALTGGVPDPARRTITVNGVDYTIGELCGVNRGGIFEFELPSGKYEMY